MTHKKQFNSGRIFIGGIVITGILFYFVSANNLFARYKNNTNTATTSSYTCPMMRNAANQGGGGCGGGSRTTAPTTNTIPTQTAADPTIVYETVNVGHSAYALVPETLTLAAGKSYKLIITPTADGGGCMNNMTIPGLDDNVYPVKKDVPVTITINNAKAGNYEMICGNMGMHQGYIVIK